MFYVYVLCADVITLRFTHIIIGSTATGIIMTSQRMQWSGCLLLMMMLILTRDVTNDATAVPVQRSRMPASLADICDVACRQVRRFFESLDLRSLFMVCMYIFRISMGKFYIKVIGSRLRSRSKKSVSVYPVRGWSAFD